MPRAQACRLSARTLGWLLAAFAGLPAPGFADAVNAGHIVGTTAVGRQVADLDRSLRYYRALGMVVISGPTRWTSTAAEAQLFAAPGAEWRTAVLAIDSALYADTFRLQLREFRHAKRRDWNTARHTVRGFPHIGFLAQHPQAVWNSLKQQGLLRSLTRGDELVKDAHGEPDFGLMLDPDGMGVEVRGLRSPPYADRPAWAPAERPGFSHAALVVSDMIRTRSFYQHLGLEFPDNADQWISGRFFDDAWTLPPGTQLRVAYAYGAAATHAPRAQMPMEFVEFASLDRDSPGEQHAQLADAGVQVVILEVEGIESIYRELLAAGATRWSNGIVALPDQSRSVILRDPDVGGFIQLIELPVLSGQR